MIWGSKSPNWVASFFIFFGPQKPSVERPAVILPPTNMEPDVPRTPGLDHVLFNGPGPERQGTSQY